MEIRKHSTDNFERFLKDKADEFRMYPSRRVWYSIYNNMHPGNRFPSVSMAIVLTALLFLVGYLNTTEVNKTAIAKNSTTAVIAVNNSSGNTANSMVAANHVFLNGNAETAATVAPTVSIKPHTTQVSRTLRRTAATGIVVSSAAADIAEQTVASVNNSQAAEPTAGIKDNLLNIAVLNEEDAVNNKDITAVTADPAASSVEPFITGNAEKTANGNIPAVTAAPIPNNNAAGKSIALATTVTAADKGWIEDYGMHNRPAAKPWAGKVSLQAYITPSVVYRKLRNNVPDKILSSGNIVAGNQNVNDIVNHKPSIGIETGVALQYDFTKRIKLKAGVQLNYTRYNAHAFATGHPVSTSIMFSGADGNSVYESYRTSDYSNAYGLVPAKLHNETYQFSIPLGADVRIASLDNISWYAGATIQPTLVLYGKSYVISTDKRYYVNDPSLLNRLNVNAGFETYVSYKTQSGYTWQLGPQFRTQVFSTNTKSFAVEERLQNFGFKIGVLKRL